MVGSFDQFADARNSDGANCGHDQLFAPKINLARSGYLAAGLILFAVAATADPIRIATFTTDLSRDGPGLLLRDIERGEDPQIAAVRSVIDNARADIITLQSIDWDLENRSAHALNDGLERPYPFIFSSAPNTGVDSGLDIDQDHRFRGPGDAFGYGNFTGQKGMAVFSRYPIQNDQVVDLSDLAWQDIPGARLPHWPNGDPYFADDVLSVLPLSTTGHWDVPVAINPDRVLRILTLHPTPPVFDGTEDRNGHRNADEVRLWGAYLSGALEVKPLGDHHVVSGNLNLDPNDGDGHRKAFFQLLETGQLQDTTPSSDGAEEAARQGGANDRHIGNAAYDTADWREGNGPGNLRVDYVLPSRRLTVIGSGVLWPTSDSDFHSVVATASRHRLVWVDIDF